MNKHVTVAEIGPRDGFQSISCMMIPTETKLEIIEAILASGVKKLQCTSFVSPKAIPQMQDATQIAQTLLEKHPEVDLFALVPNFRGAQSAVEAGLKTVSPVISLSVSHNQNNVRRTHEQSFDELKRIMDTFPELNIDLDVATAFGCPFEGRMTVPALVDFVGKLYDLGIRSFNICDTIGVAYPTQIRETFQALMAALLGTYPRHPQYGHSQQPGGGALRGRHSADHSGRPGRLPLCPRRHRQHRHGRLCLSAGPGGL